MSNEKVDFSLKETSPKIGGGRVSGSERLTSSFDLVEQLHFLYVRIVRARGLAEPCDPFVEIKIGNYRATSRDFENRFDPEWNQVFAFTKDRIQAVSVEVSVRDKVSAAIIGVVSFPISDIPSRVPPDSPLAPIWYILEDQDGKKGERGELMMTVWMGTQADEVFPEAWHADAAAVSGESITNTRSKVYLSPRLWYLRINIIQAQDLVFPNRNRKPEVLVKGILGHLVLRSRVSKDNSINPTWNEDMMFVAAEPFDDPLTLTVEDKIGENMEECLGKCVIHLSKVQKRNLPMAASANWYNLERIVKEGEEGRDVRFASRLHMRVSLDGGYHVADESTYYSSDFRATAKMLWKAPIGVLELGILNATGLIPMKSKNQKGTTDAYCVAKYGPKWVRTRTIVDSLVPKWHEQYTWEVYDPYTVISIGVFDNCHLEGGRGRDQTIGKVRIRLSTLQSDRIYTLSYPLIVLHLGGVKKMGELQLAVRFTCSNLTNLLICYSQPLFPKMHYSHPLSVFQIDSLRDQASNILCLRLSRAEPPLRREVVEYMLDVGSNMWSMRKGKANFARIVAALDGLVVAWKYLNEICKWKNPTGTVFAHFLFLVVLANPQMIIVAFFVGCFFLGLWNFRNRPRRPLHMDTKISLAETATPDELDEEFDRFPSAAPVNRLRVRYDRLRGIAGRCILVMGDIATQLERFRSLLSWRDPRATMLFVAFCFVASVVVFVTPYKVLLAVGGFYVMRHPRLRVSLPSAPQNFFRRLPTRLDSML
ncbi:hypothetical protein SLEP1_g33836 [Rubroshorea leprosula]|uniref:C2 domain-containing protein n=1 Tax=Rubroshorea leprosula TaxID=152421 RepID=A0AAV5KHV6_9ROSI|nr:hypothetical protein SLEP1_g33836 [Rubroshorea leprosula]